MAYHLIVRHHFGRYQIGQRIDDPAEVAQILSGPNEHSVVKIAAPDLPAPSVDSGHEHGEEDDASLHA